ncbi:hypothetical protein H0H93_004297 [Arthromyces matolae]|nr:hypothetical protein H0H93_004297 [Arthromyces matolae]
MVVDDIPPEDTGAAEETCTTVVADPPPPYPSRERRRTRAHRHPTIQAPHAHAHSQLSSYDSHSDHDGHPSPQISVDDYDEVDEGGNDANIEHSLRPIPHTPHHRHTVVRPRSHSLASTASVAPSLAQTMISMFSTHDDEDDEFNDDVGAIYLPLLNEDEQNPRRRRRSFATWWRRYLRPLNRKAYYSSLFHLVVVNFPYALAAWIYLFVFTVAGTTLLMALPLGAILCFFNLLGARAFARGELYLQSKFHYPLSYPSPYPPRPIFTRRREATSAEIESGAAATGDLVYECSFYKNSYAMFTDPTSYQALFYFLVIKPSITIVFSLVILIFVLPALILVLPAPAALRAVRRLGIWQANVAVEGLYLALSKVSCVLYSEYLITKHGSGAYLQKVGPLHGTKWLISVQAVAKRRDSENSNRLREHRYIPASALIAAQLVALDVRSELSR